MNDGLMMMTQYATFFAIKARCAALDAIAGTNQWHMERASILAAIHECRCGQPQPPELAAAYARLAAFAQAHMPPAPRNVWIE